MSFCGIPKSSTALYSCPLLTLSYAALKSTNR
jgi:hypothetical protein